MSPGKVGDGNRDGYSPCATLVSLGEEWKRVCIGTILLLFQLSFGGYGNWVKINSIDKLVPSVFWGCYLLVIKGKGALHSFIRTKWLPHKYFHTEFWGSVSQAGVQTQTSWFKSWLGTDQLYGFVKTSRMLLMFLKVKIWKTIVLHSGFTLCSLWVY